MTQWMDVPEGSYTWDWLEYRGTIECICGKVIELYDADLDPSDCRLTCECGRVYGARLVYQVKAEDPQLWPRVGHTDPPILMIPSPQFEQPGVT